MRVAHGWRDANILNLSSRGMLVQSGSGSAPQRGSYLEICRGRHIIVARVVWTQNDVFGIRTQDPLPAAQLIREPDAAPPSAQPAVAVSVDRRSSGRSGESRHEASRRRGRAMEFGSLTLLGGAVALLLFASVGELIARPIAMVQTALKTAARD
jgi:hypothetical protein